MHPPEFHRRSCPGVVDVSSATDIADNRPPGRTADRLPLENACPMLAEENDTRVKQQSYCDHPTRALRFLLVARTRTRTLSAKRHHRQRLLTRAFFGLRKDRAEEDFVCTLDMQFFSIPKFS